MKEIELAQSQIKAYEAGATMFLFPIDRDILFNKVAEWCKKYQVSPFDSYWYNEAVKSFSPIQKGDKDIFVKEDFVYSFDPMFQICGDIYYKAEEPDIMSKWTPALQMPKEQSRYSFSECIDVRVVKVQKVSFGEWTCLLGGTNHNLVIPTIEIASNFYNQQMQELGLNRTYEDNDYAFLVEFRR